MYELTDKVSMIAHNEIARTVYLIHTDRKTISVFLPDLSELKVIELEHEVERFTHFNAVTCLSGIEGASVLLGAEVIEKKLGLGPYRFLNGKLLDPVFMTKPDIRGEEYTENKLGTLELEKHYGEPKAAENYRGFTMAYFQDNPEIFSVWGKQISPAPIGVNIQEKVLGEIYSHSHLRLIKIATQDGWIFSVDDGKYWRFHEQNGWPINISDDEVWIVEDKFLYNREEI